METEALPGAPVDDIDSETARLLHGAGIQIAVAETGTGGEIGRRLAATPEGRAVLTEERIYRTPHELAAGLQVSRAKVEAFGAVSAMVAAEGAADLIDTYEGGWGLVVVVEAGNQPTAQGVQSEGRGPVGGFIALGTPCTTVIEQWPADQLLRATFDLLRRQALSRLKQA